MLPMGLLVEVRNRIRIHSVLSASISLVLIQPPPYKIGERWALNYSFFV